jgi:hypothetical protein
LLKKEQGVLNEVITKFEMQKKEAEDKALLIKEMKYFLPTIPN